MVALGIGAWTRGRRLGQRWMWNALAWLLALASAGALGRGLLSLPAAIALYRFAARSPDLWRAD